MGLLYLKNKLGIKLLALGLRICYNINMFIEKNRKTGWMSLAIILAAGIIASYLILTF